MGFYSNNRYDGERSLIKAENEGRLSEDDRNLIVAFGSEKVVRDHISERRHRKIIFTLVNWRRFTPVQYADATINDVYNAIHAMKTGVSTKGTPFKQNTIHDHIRILKPFLLWLIEEGHNTTLPEKKIKQIKAPGVQRQTTDPDEILTPEEIRQMIAAPGNARDRALIATLYESGCRVGELATIRWKDVVFDEYGVKLYITDHKAGESRRYSRLTLATEFLAQWKNEYRFRNPAGDAVVFVSLRDGVPLKHIAVVRIIEKIRLAAGIEKKVTPHLFRKSRITHMIAENYQESVIKQTMWGNLGTGMFATYVCLAEKDIDNEFLDKAGIVMKEDAINPLAPVTCHQCHTVNPPTNTYCGKCGLPLAEEVKVLDDKVAEILSYDPKIIQAALRELAKM